MSGSYGNLTYKLDSLRVFTQGHDPGLPGEIGITYVLESPGST